MTFESIIVEELQTRLGTDHCCLDYMDMPLELFLSEIRARKALASRRIKTLGEFSHYSEKDLSKVRNIWEKSVAIIKDDITKAGGWLRKTSEDDTPIENTPEFLIERMKTGNAFLAGLAQEKIKPVIINEEIEKRLHQRLSGDVQVIAQGFAENAETVFPDQNESMQMIPAHQVIFTDDIVKELVQKGYKVGVQLVIENPQSKTQKNPNIL